MKILILSAIKKKLLLKLFYNESKKYNFKIIVADSNLTQNNINFGKKYCEIILKSPQYGIKYIKWLSKIVIKYNIKLVIPTNSKEIFYTEKLRNIIKKKTGGFLTGVPINIATIVNDKKKLFNFLKKNKIETPQVYSLKNNIDNYKKIVIKKRFGQASKGLKIIRNINKKNKNISRKIYDKNNIIQEYLQGDEYGLDILNNFKRKYEGVLVRKKILMKNGETKIAKIIKPEKFTNLSKKISKIIKHVGPIDVDVIRLKNKNYVIDINPRFGGGYSLSHKAGANIPGFLVSLIKRKKSLKQKFLKQNFGKIYKQ